MEQDDSPIRFAESGPTVIMVCGVNGAGKTTSIAKLAQHVQVARARACCSAPATRSAPRPSSSSRSGASGSASTIVTGEPGSHPASVAYRAVEQAIKNGIDVCIVDTAGRLQTQKNLMAELTKIQDVDPQADPRGAARGAAGARRHDRPERHQPGDQVYRSGRLHRHRARQARRHGQGRRGRRDPPAGRPAGEVRRRRRKGRGPGAVPARRVRRRPVRRHRRARPPPRRRSADCGMHVRTAGSVTPAGDRRVRRLATAALRRNVPRTSVATDSAAACAMRRARFDFRCPRHLRAADSVSLHAAAAIVAPRASAELSHADTRRRFSPPLAVVRCATAGAAADAGATQPVAVVHRRRLLPPGRRVPRQRRRRAAARARRQRLLRARVRLRRLVLRRRRCCGDGCCDCGDGCGCGCCGGVEGFSLAGAHRPATDSPLADRRLDGRRLHGQQRAVVASVQRPAVVRRRARPLPPRPAVVLPRQARPTARAASTSAAAST